MICKEKVDICLLQETEIASDYPIELLSTKDFKIETEKSLSKARTAIIIRNGINYEIKKELERTDCGIIILDVISNINYHIINVYRQFNPPTNLSQLLFFKLQLEIIQKAFKRRATKSVWLPETSIWMKIRDLPLITDVRNFLKFKQKFLNPSN